MKLMKKFLAGESSLLDCGELQLQAALSMEARSRTPLPPSPTSQSVQDSNLSSKSQIGFPDLGHSVANSLANSKRTKPSKPPRKCLPTNKPPVTEVISQNDYEPIDKYDQVEYRSDAWRTLGVDDPNHTEQPNDEEEQEYLSWGNKKESEDLKPAVKPLAPKIITQNSMTDLGDTYYDKLNFFGSCSRLNVKPGYKQVLPSPIAPVVTPPTFNEYDEVQCLDMEPVRLADDSHLGYALVRKDPGKEGLKEEDKNSKEKPEKVSHQFHNAEPYAVISKPKRV